MYEYKPLNYGYVIITPENNPNFVKITANSIRNNNPDASIICVARNDIDTESEKIIQNICKLFKGENTYTSLISEGIKNPPSEWNLYIISGTHLENKIQKKYSYFVENEKDILYPVIDRKMNFVDGSINGILMHKNVKNLGCIPESNSLQKSKMIWSFNAACQGYKFKGIVGVKY